jgi:hypothetical protein
LYYTNVQNGKSVVSFGGTHLLRNAFSSISQPVTMFYATQVNQAGATLNGLATLGPTFQGLAENSGLFFTNQGANNFLTASSSSGTFTLLCAIINGSASTGYVNGSSNTTVHNPGTASLLSYTVGGAGAIASWIGLMGEIAIYNRALALSEVTQVFNYLGPKWGITIT